MFVRTPHILPTFFRDKAVLLRQEPSNLHSNQHSIVYVWKAQFADQGRQWEQGQGVQPDGWSRRHGLKANARAALERSLLFEEWKAPSD